MKDESTILIWLGILGVGAYLLRNSKLGGNIGGGSPASLPPKENIVVFRDPPGTNSSVASQLPAQIIVAPGDLPLPEAPFGFVWCAQQINRLNHNVTYSLVGAGTCFPVP